MIDKYLESISLSLIFMLLVLTLSIPQKRKSFLSRNRANWLVEASSLLVHLYILPLLQTITIIALMDIFATPYKEKLEVPWWGSVLFYFFIDYCWYWNHRLLHSRTVLWNFHMVHHSAEHLDFLSTPRNSFWSPFLMVYFWLIPIFIFFLNDPSIFLFCVSFGVLINFWGHTDYNLKAESRLSKFLALFLVMPVNHFWHHSYDKPYCNFGTVLNIWDRLHRTWYEETSLPRKIGFRTNMSPLKQIFYPFIGHKKD